MTGAALSLVRLTLGRFRSYFDLAWRPEGRLVVVTGPNGSGKTNLLEAISFLAPGRGLRGARPSEVAQGGEGAWAVHGRLDTPDGPTEIATGTTEDAPERRIFRLDGVPVRSQAALSARISAVWLTPQMDRLFQEGASFRRRFLDRLVLALEPLHAREVAAFETAMAGRNRLLAEGRKDVAWLAGLEEEMARHAVAVTAARADLARRLNDASAAGAAAGFPQARLDLVCGIAERLATAPALAVEDWLRAELEAARPRDAHAGTARIGAHRTDFTLSDRATGLVASQASTGQQKALLVGVILAHAALLSGARGAAPLLLLDEPAVHLDVRHREALFAALAALPAQAFLTGTDDSVFAPLAGQAVFWTAGEGALRR